MLYRCYRTTCHSKASTMNLVQPALRRPLTVIVLVIALVLGAWVALQRMTRDIFPPLGIPTIYVAQPYGGMDPAQMEGYLTYYYEYHFLYITGIEHVESKSIQGASIMKLQFHPGHGHVPGDVGGDRLREPRARLHAAGDGARRSSRASTPAACRSAT